MFHKRMHKLALQAGVAQSALLASCPQLGHSEPEPLSLDPWLGLNLDVYVPSSHKKAIEMSAKEQCCDNNNNECDDRSANVCLGLNQGLRRDDQCNGSSGAADRC
jgi:hypothetical protein